MHDIITQKVPCYFILKSTWTGLICRNREVVDMGKLKLPLGVEYFEEMVQRDFYYVDKTGLIHDVLGQPLGVTLFHRPKSFGKTLALSMLEKFFAPEGDKQIFDGLAILREKALCREHMGRYPVISIPLHAIYASSYETAFQLLVRRVNEVVSRAQYLKDSTRLSGTEKILFAGLMSRDMDESALSGSLRLLSRLLSRHHGQSVVILIDDYDAPLEKAKANGYYGQMEALIKNMLEQTLLMNDCVQFAVLAGRGGILKEAFFPRFSGSFPCLSMFRHGNAYFGFTDKEIWKLLDHYGLSDEYDSILKGCRKDRYGNIQVYCPSDVMDHCAALKDIADCMLHKR